MKKKLLFLISIITFGITNAQTKEKGTIEITPKIGWSVFYEDGQYHGSDYHTGMEFGATADYYFNNRWSLRSGLIFDEMGGEYYTASSKFVDKLNYLSVPINMNWHFGSTRKWNLNFGLSPSFLLNAKTNGSDISKNIESFQLAATYGIGYKIEVTKKFGILLDYQFFAGLTNTNRATVEEVRNVGFSFNVGGVIEL